MGLGIQFRAKLDGTRGSDHGPLVAIEAAALQCAEAHGMRDFFSRQLHDGKLYLQLHPAAEWVEFELLEGGTLFCVAKTSTVGPGYHRYVIEILDAIAKRLAASWEAGGDVEGDDTGYFEQRDFARLQHEMVVFLESLSASVQERSAKGYSGMMLNMPLNFAVAVVEGIVTPGGVFAPSRFDHATKRGLDVDRFAEDFFLWWDEGLTARTWKNLGMVLMWSEVPWHVPADEVEAAVCVNALRCFELARALDPGIELPAREIAELAELVAEDADWAREPASVGIGYRRLMWNRCIGRHWTVKVPGYFYSRIEDDEATEVFWIGSKEVWCTSFTVEPVKPVTLADLGEHIKPDSLIVEDAGFVGCANIERRAGEHGEYRIMFCRFRAPGSRSAFSIIYSGDRDARWAEETFRSVRFTPPKNEN